MSSPAELRPSQSQPLVPDNLRRPEAESKISALAYRVMSAVWNFFTSLFHCFNPSRIDEQAVNSPRYQIINPPPKTPQDIFAKKFITEEMDDAQIASIKRDLNRVDPSDLELVSTMIKECQKLHQNAPFYNEQKHYATTGYRVDLIHALVNISARDRIDVIRCAFRFMDTSTMLYKRIHLIEFFTSKINEMKTITDLASRIVLEEMTDDNKLAILKIIANIASEEREEFVNYIVDTYSGIQKPEDRYKAITNFNDFRESNAKQYLDLLQDHKRVRPKPNAPPEQIGEPDPIIGEPDQYGELDPS